MSKHNKVNPDHYHQAGRLSQDEAARERVRIREATSRQRGADEIVPLPATDTPEEHDRVRRSNDRDQQREREGKPSRHNEGYDDAADGAARTNEKPH